MKQDPILALLRNQKEPISGEEISSKLKVTRAAVWKEIENLREIGYKISALPGRGYRLSSVPDKLFADEIAHGLTNKIVGREILSFDETDSTNDVAFKLGEQGLKEGVCVFTEHQRKGRGRLGRAWASPKGKNVLFSVLLRPALPPAEASRITLAAALAVVRAAAKHTGKTPGIKWPNDVLLDGRKLCGILTEMSAEQDRVKFVVLGIGVNVNSGASELPPGAVSLKEAAGHAVSRVDFARDLLSELEVEYLRLRDGKFEEIARDWESHSVTSGRRVTATVLGRRVEGQATGIDADGALWIRRDDGLQERVMAGDVEAVKPKTGGRNP